MDVPASEPKPPPARSDLLALVEGTIEALRGRHPGIVAEAVVERITSAYVLEPRETHHRERRRNHPERIRRLAHAAYRILADPESEAPERDIAEGVLRAFVLTPRPGEGPGGDAP